MLQVLPTCEWSAYEAEIAETTVASLRSLNSNLVRGNVSMTTGPPLFDAAQLAIDLLPTNTYGPLFDHWIDRSFLRAARSEVPDPSVRGTWGTWVSLGCKVPPGATRQESYRTYQAELLDLEPPIDAYGYRYFKWYMFARYDSCYHYTNRPKIFGAIHPIVKCNIVNTGAMVGQIHVPDDHCATNLPDTATGEMAVETAPES